MNKKSDIELYDPSTAKQRVMLKATLNNERNKFSSNDHITNLAKTPKILKQKPISKTILTKKFYRYKQPFITRTRKEIELNNEIKDFCTISRNRYFRFTQKREIFKVELVNPFKKSSPKRSQKNNYKNFCNLVHSELPYSRNLEISDEYDNDGNYLSFNINLKKLNDQIQQIKEYLDNELDNIQKHISLAIPFNEPIYSNFPLQMRIIDCYNVKKDNLFNPEFLRLFQRK